MPLNHQELYGELLDRIKEITLINSCGALLGWDEQTYMPQGGAEHRANQESYLAGLGHKKATDPRIGEILAELEKSDLVKDPVSDSAVIIRETRRDYDKQVKLPQRLVEELSKTTSLSQSTWIQARKENDYPKFLPWLEKVIKLDQEKADCLGYKKERYDALLDEYEPGSSVEFVARTFGGFRDRLVSLVAKIANSSRKPNLAIIEQDYPVDRQKIFGQEAAVAIGYDYRIGRLDIAAHPFTTGIGPGDTRITTRYNPRHLGQALFGILHEAGHGMYDQGLDKSHYGTPRGESVSLGIHESQSRMWENQVGRGKPFWKHFFPRAQQVFPEALTGVKFEDFYFAINDVRPSLIRVEADEVTYNLHILLRFEMEHALIKGDLTAKDLPGAWNEKFHKFFGLTPPSNADGCMQDIHWSSGYFGYFPTYTLGNLYSAQLYAKAKETMPDMEEKFSRGDFSGLKSWLNEKIHRPGRTWPADKLCEVVTGKPLDSAYLMNYLERKYGELYGV